MSLPWRLQHEAVVALLEHVRHAVEGQADGPERDPGPAAVPVVAQLVGELRAGQAAGEQPDVVEYPSHLVRRRPELGW